MYHGQLGDSTFWSVLLRFDEDLAARARVAPCPFCGARLDRSDYPRKPRGGPEGLGPAHRIRFSFCCSAEGCRRRVTPPSVRFFGRRVYLGAVFLVLSDAMRGGLTRSLARRLRIEFGIDRRTLVRWRAWWRDAFPESSFWRVAAGRLVPRPAVSELPSSLLLRFLGEASARLAGCLSFLAPLTTGASM